MNELLEGFRAKLPKRFFNRIAYSIDFFSEDSTRCRGDLFVWQLC